jgi:FSR family fosmidomycin resistance protein-like MFS transporter
LLDELVFGAREAAWPAIRADLSLSYAQIGLILAVPSLVATVVEPLLGLASVTWRRSTLILAGGVVFAAALGVAAAASSFVILLVAFCALYPASGAFVSLSQAALMDFEPAQRQHNMARWTFAGAVGALFGPLLLGVSGLGWRGLLAALALPALALVVVARRLPSERDEAEPLQIREALRTLAQPEVFRWLFLVEISNLLVDVLLGFLALYFVDDVGTSVAAGGLAVAVWTAAGLAGSALSIPVLRRIDGLRYLRASAAATLVLFAAFLLVPDIAAKLALVGAIAVVNAGWYPVLQARLYGALDGASGLVLTIGALFPLNAVLPLAIGALAERWSLGVALWPLAAAPLALLLLVPRQVRPPRGRA